MEIKTGIIPRIVTMADKLLVGKRISMGLADNKTTALWKSFMPERKMISGLAGNDLVSASVYQPGYFEHFNPQNEFEKWAAVEVVGHNDIPHNMEPLTIPGGLYAVFDYTGPANDPGIYQYIFGTWLPGSGYKPDTRPHFEILGEKYRHNDPSSEEEIWIPIKSIN